MLRLSHKFGQLNSNWNLHFSFDLKNQNTRSISIMAALVKHSENFCAINGSCLGNSTSSVAILAGPMFSQGLIIEPMGNNSQAMITQKHKKTQITLQSNSRLIHKFSQTGSCSDIFFNPKQGHPKFKSPNERITTFST